jgi:DNA mismatch repair ATPase MutS
MGTNVKDALDASRAILSRLAGKTGSVFVVSSHLIEVADTLVATGAVDCYRFDAIDRNGRLEFDYVLRAGISSQRLGVRVLREQGVFDLLDQETPAA